MADRDAWVVYGYSDLDSHYKYTKRWQKYTQASTAGSFFCWGAPARFSLTTEGSSRPLFLLDHPQRQPYFDYQLFLLLNCSIYNRYQTDNPHIFDCVEPYLEQ